MPVKLDTILFAQHTFGIMRAFHTAYAAHKMLALTEFLANNFADFQYSAGKNRDFV